MVLNTKQMYKTDCNECRLTKIGNSNCLLFLQIRKDSIKKNKVIFLNFIRESAYRHTRVQMWPIYLLTIEKL